MMNIAVITSKSTSIAPYKYNVSSHSLTHSLIKHCRTMAMWDLLPYSSIFLILLFSSLTTTQAIVPPSKTFKFINDGEFDNFAMEFGAEYRYLRLEDNPPIFGLCFYKVTPDTFLLGIYMGGDEQSVFRWVWDANRGNPVREKATLTFGTDGNLVLADADGRIAWQTDTANKGVVNLKLLPNGNLVLLDARGRFVWQSFDHPTDTLLVGQSLRSSGPAKIVSRASAVDIYSDGPYSMVLEGEKLSMYLKSKNSPIPLMYFANEELSGPPLSQVVFNCAPETNEKFAYELRYDLYVNNTQIRPYVIARRNYNSTLSMLRLDIDGNLRIYTFYDKVEAMAWEVSYELFGRNGRFGECDMPSKCGSLGICNANQCVACPTQKGLLGWSDSCEPPRLPPCKGGVNSVDYFKVVDVEHFLDARVQGLAIKEEECREKCNKDCGCLGFFYWEDTKRCLLAPEFRTLKKAYNPAHVAYIKKGK